MFLVPSAWIHSYSAASILSDIYHRLITRIHSIHTMYWFIYRWMIHIQNLLVKFINNTWWKDCAEGFLKLPRICKFKSTIPHFTQLYVVIFNVFFLFFLRITSRFILLLLRWIYSPLLSSLLFLLQRRIVEIHRLCQFILFFIKLISSYLLLIISFYLSILPRSAQTFYTIQISTIIYEK